MAIELGWRLGDGLAPGVAVASGGLAVGAAVGGGEVVLDGVADPLVDGAPLGLGGPLEGALTDTQAALASPSAITNAKLIRRIRVHPLSKRIVTECASSQRLRFRAKPDSGACRQPVASAHQGPHRG